MVLNTIFHQLANLSRLEKEKKDLKRELDDMESQISHSMKNKVSCLVPTKHVTRTYTAHCACPLRTNQSPCPTTHVSGYFLSDVHWTFILPYNFYVKWRTTCSAWKWCIALPPLSFCLLKPLQGRERKATAEKRNWGFTSSNPTYY